MLRLAITDRRLFLSSAALIDRCARLARSGVDLLLIRERDLPAGELTTLARGLRATSAGTGLRILIAGRPDIAIAAPLDGVHLSSSSGELTPTEVRTVFRMANAQQPYVTVSCHTPAECARASENGADAILFAPVFGKVVAGREVSPAAGLAALHEAVRAAPKTPVLALGGVTEANTDACLEAGAAGIAAIRLFMREVRE